MQALFSSNSEIVLLILSALGLGALKIYIRMWNKNLIFL